MQARRRILSRILSSKKNQQFNMSHISLFIIKTLSSQKQQTKP